MGAKVVQRRVQSNIYKLVKMKILRLDSIQAKLYFSYKITYLGILPFASLSQDQSIKLS